MSYIINAQNSTGQWIYVKNPIVLSLKLAVRRAQDLCRLPNIQKSEICTSSGDVVKTFINKKYLTI